MLTCAFALVPPSRLSQPSFFASLLLFVPLVLSAEATGASHHITFDAPTTIAVRDVTTDEHRIAYPAARLIEVKIQISSLVRRGQEREIQELFYRFDYPAPGIEVVDYLPKTTLSSDVVGNIGMEKRSEDSSTLGLSLSGMMQPLAGTLTGGITDKDSQSIRYELLPPMETVAASGTLNRRTSVYFKLRTTPRDSLEGDKEFVVIVRVPATWRGDYVYWGCQATGSRRSAAPGLDSSAPVGRRQFVMSLYLEGDEEAREVAERFSWAELRLRRVAVRHDAQITKRATPTVVHKVGAWLSVVPRKIPDDWLEHLLIASPHAASSTLLPRLPEPVQKAARDYLLAKQQLAAMGNR